MEANFSKAEKLLLECPWMANSWIGEECNISMQTVDRIRKELESIGKIEVYEKFLRRDEKISPRKYTKGVA